MTQKIDGSQMAAPRVGAAGAGGVDRAGLDRAKAVAASQAGDSVQLTGEASSLQTLQREMTSTPVMDMAKIDAVRSALASGTLRIDPQQIATRMMALEQELGK